MLELKNITKDYPAGDSVVHALRGIDLTFRRSDFVSILGPSGCGKTTLLNIIGGLDHYTSGDLFINGRSTKDFKDRDWDTYRNHSVGFVFQSYNLIPHQTVLQNVELALTLSGVAKAERRARAIAALEEVGLGEQIHKRPAQMSGGQMQRVAIARALVNDPDIILADEPTGALDSETSVQVMELLKKVAENRLVIMVTHNPDLADTYSTRIIRMVDGNITNDTHPLSDAELAAERANDVRLAEEAALALAENKKTKIKKRSSMSFGTAFMLSLKNLFTKKGRTLLTSFAGSIGIIGIALILAVSTGTNAYIDAVQEETLSSYPITLESQTVDLTALMQSFMNATNESSDHSLDKVYKKMAISNMLNAILNLETHENDLQSFKTHLENELKKEDATLKDAVNGVSYNYPLDLLIYTKNVDDTIIVSDTQALMVKMVAAIMGTTPEIIEQSGSTMMVQGVTLWQELLKGTDGSHVNDLLKDQYELVNGDWPNDYNEVVLVLDENNELDDLTLYALGLLPESSIQEIIDAVTKGKEIPTKAESWSYDEIRQMTFKTILGADCYRKNADGTYTDLRETPEGLAYLYNDRAITLRVSGIIRPSDKATTTMLTGSIGYTAALTEEVIRRGAESDIVKAQLENPEIDVLTGRPFRDNDLTNAEKKAALLSHISKMTDLEKIATYTAICCIMDPDLLKTQTDAVMQEKDVAAMRTELIGIYVQQTGMSTDLIAEHINGLSDDEVKAAYRQIAEAGVQQAYAAQVMAQLAQMDAPTKLAAFEAALATYTDEQFGSYYDAVVEFSDASYDEVLRAIGAADLAVPSMINIYASSFENKDVIEKFIADYNVGKEDYEQIRYTDYVGLLMGSITTIINAITYVLIAFVAISLIVSSIMIGVITLISVQERTKEIGILRAIGASKGNVSSMFNAETIIIGFAAGLVGVVFTYLACIPINLILYALTDIASLRAFLSPWSAIILIAISVVLTLIAGIIPSRSAAKKDPVVALRTE